MTEFWIVTSGRGMLPVGRKVGYIPARSPQEAEEYRVFVKGRHIQGITRYDHFNPPKREHTPDVVMGVEHEAARYLDAINPHFPLDDYVFDIGMRDEGSTLIVVGS